MRKFLAVVVSTTLLSVSGYAVAETVPTAPTNTCTTGDQAVARAILDSSYAHKRWQHRHPLGNESRAKLDALSACLAPSDRHEIKKAQDKAKESFFEYRKFRLVAPHYCGFGGPSPAPGYFAIDCNVVCGESRGDWHVNADGAYQIIPSTWRGAGGGRFSSTAGGATPLEQSVIAHKLEGKTPWYGYATDC